MAEPVGALDVHAIRCPPIALSENIQILMRESIGATSGTASTPEPVPAPTPTLAPVSTPSPVTIPVLPLLPR